MRVGVAVRASSGTPTSGALVEHPILIEQPIIIRDDARAVDELLRPNASTICFARSVSGFAPFLRCQLAASETLCERNLQTRAAGRISPCRGCLCVDARVRGRTCWVVMMRRNSTTLLALVALLGLAAWGANVDATTVNKCLGRKLAGVGRSLARRATCYAKNATRPAAAALSLCLAKAEDSFVGGDVPPSGGSFARLERTGPCLTTDDQRAVDTTLTEYAAALDAQMANPGMPNRCDAAKLACVGRYVVGITGCYANAAAKSGSVDPACLAKSGARLSDGAHGCLDKAEAPGSACSVTDDVTALQGVADQFVADTLCVLDPAGAVGCGSTPTPSLTPSGPTPLRTASATPIRTATPTRTPTATRTASPTRTPTPTASSARTPTPISTANNDAAQLCVDTINTFRASIGLPAFARWTANETCVDGQGLADSQSGTPHSAFGQCSEWAQNECQGWPGTPMSMIGSCLQAMWNEGPGSNYSTHGHYINMTNRQYTKVACGFAALPNGTVWATQDFQ
jgi:hypothetical protein